VASWHLRHLAGFGLIVDADPSEVPGDRRQRWWKATAKGFTVPRGNDPDTRMLIGSMITMAQAQVTTWLSDVEPNLEPEWQQLGGLSNTSVPLTPAELETLARQIDELIAPYVHRGEAPAEARIVRILRQYLPEAST
jgi:hypothetical protein